MPVCEDWLGNPLSIVNNLFESNQENYETKISEYFENKFNNHLHLIPCINELESLDHLPSTCLVRYRCMVQDSFNPIYFNSIQHLKHKQSNEIKMTTLKYKETLDHSDDFEIFNREEQLENGTWRVNTAFDMPNDRRSEFEALKQRLTLYCVPVPGESDWTQSHRVSTHHNQTGLKKSPSTNDFSCLVKIYDDFDEFRINDMVEFIGILHKSESLAYMHDEHHNDHIQDQPTTTKADENKMETGEPKVLTSYLPSKVPRLHCLKYKKLLHNNPLIKAFETTRKNIDELMDEEESEDKQKQKAREEFRIEKINYWQNELNKLNHDLLTSTDLRDKALVNSLNKDKLPLFELRQELVNCFQELLLGDSLAAEYLLMNLISSVFTRKDVTVLGKFALNIFNVTPSAPLAKVDTIGSNETGNAENPLKPPATTTTPNEPTHAKGFAESFFKYIKEFLTMSQLFSLTVNNLNKANLIPSKDYNKDRLVPGDLQLPDNFNLIIDETSLVTGQLTQKGLMNVNSFKEIIQWQKMSYDFGFHSHDFLTNIRVLVLSQTKSILPFDCQLKLKSNVEIFDAETYENYMNDLIARKYSNLMNHFRNYLTIVSQLDYKLNDSMQKIIEQDIVNIKQHSFATHLNKETTPNEKKSNQMGIEDFHTMLVIARLQAISYGKTELSINEWNKAKNLEFERLTHRITN